MESIFFKADHDCIEQSVTYNLNSIQKLYDSETLEVVRYTFNQGSFLYVDPLWGDESYKSYMVISGKCRELANKRELSPGDLLLVRDTQEMITLYMLEHTEFLVQLHIAEGISRFKKSSVNMIALLTELQEKDQYTKAHSDRVYSLAKQMGLKMGYHSRRIYNLNKAAHFHDIGKIFIEDAILNKPDKLTEEEFCSIEKHVTLGEKLVLSNYEEVVFKIIEQHHERMDGSGYPLGLKGEEILEEARILAICDSYDAMITDRVYKKGKTIDGALTELLALSGSLYDEKLVRVFVDLVKNDLGYFRGWTEESER